ncbi:hypothetical protein ARMSODRAFT_208439 [Armillaria solidipes]|uniref:DUF6533 domain-containing protein n=1 Tax=Armillaria solidipes TaxID=1076256 RepID=A0A2H3BNT5_9AGAR|nr:hypothetical protein ARMSODRAFT_208439 [Armillaria solidipes]
MPGLLDAFIEHAYNLYRINTNARVFSFAWTWWEFAIILDDEISLIWMRWSWIKFLFLMNRYHVLFAQTFDLPGYLLPQPSYNVRNVWLGYITIINGTLQIFISDIILIIRLGEIYGRKKSIVVPVVALFVLTMAASVTVLAIQSMQWTGTNMPLPGVYLCALTSKLYILYAYWIPIVVFETLMFLLAAFRVIAEFNTPKMESTYGPRSLLEIVVRDSLLYFVVCPVDLYVSYDLKSTQNGAGGKCSSNHAVVRLALPGRPWNRYRNRRCRGDYKSG